MSLATYDILLHAARHLSLADRLRLASALVSEAVSEVPEPARRPRMSHEEAYATLDAVRAHFAAQGPVSPTIAEDLAASRR
ncbi:hypothetical protein [Candidatus Oscillochloris fontis]|uniref:hypothetical protein n=1 Tax=Candidatus Oscillochloris fontis TaxID=2496868 RepID=UPI00101C59EB|nr:MULTISPECIES: hypothetical protein [Oscillochloris]